ncbi:MAG: alpha/beta hydrolase [Myxococcota bacterium]
MGPTMPGVSARQVTTPRLRVHLLESGPTGGVPVLFVHGNASSAVFWEETMLALPPGTLGLAPDLRGYGGTEDRPVDATRGVGDWVDDLIGLLDTLGHHRVHLVGHSLGGVVVFGLIAAHPARVLSATLVAPGSPYGFGGTRADGTPWWPDCAGTGGGAVNPEFARRMAAGDRSTDDPQASPRNVMNTFYWKPPFRAAREEELLSSLLSEKVGPERYPGDSTPSPNWPGVAPGVFGPINALSPRHAGGLADRFVAAAPKPPVLWIRGDSDQIVSDTSLFDFGTLGQLGFVPGWPGADQCPPQPMVRQVRATLERYAAAGGSFREVVLADTGHTPYLERPEAFAAALHPHLSGR